MDYIEHNFNFSLPTELNMYCCGKREKTSKHRYGPVIRDSFLLTYVREGKGILDNGSELFELSPNDLIVVYPGEMISYKTDDDTPWSITWIGVYGSLVEKLLDMLKISKQKPIYRIINSSAVDEIMEDLFETSSKDDLDSNLHCISQLFEFFSILAKNVVPEAKKIDYIKEAIKYIEFHYEQKITLLDVAKAINLDNSYLSKIFKRETGVTVTEWIRNYRIKKACHLLLTTDMTIRQIAVSVGIGDQLYFSKVFKKIMNVSPSGYRDEKRRKV